MAENYYCAICRKTHGFYTIIGRNHLAHAVVTAYKARKKAHKQYIAGAVFEATRRR